MFFLPQKTCFPDYFSHTAKKKKFKSPRFLPDKLFGQIFLNSILSHKTLFVRGKKQKTQMFLFADPKPFFALIFHKTHQMMRK